ncbi:CCA tRNA nucleotidyltransferase [Rickettsiales bacterium]|nr:CCA tRNA nucleotidyltransferase [Rickettsiales bacterium]
MPNKYSLTNNPGAIEIFNALGADNVRFVGGCVRDHLINKPINDIDMATSLTPEEVLSKLKSCNIKAIPTGIEHGTITAVIKEENIEITTLRKDTNCDGRHAEVSFTDKWEEDAARRDFTINALYMDNKGKIYDYFNGQDDLKSGIIRFVGNPEERCREDYLRILRFFRFYARFATDKPDAESLNACIKYKDKLSELSGERIQNEVIKLLYSKMAAETIDLMISSKILENILPDLGNYNYMHKIHEIEEQWNLKIDAMLRFALLLYFIPDLTQKDALSIISNWKFSNRYGQKIMDIRFAKAKFSINMPIAEQKRIIRKIGNDRTKDISIVFASIDYPNRSFYKEIYDLANSWKAPTFPLSGKDLIAKKVSPGKQMGDLLKKAEEYWEDNDYLPTSQDLLKYLNY